MRRFDIVVSDIRLPDGSGLELMRDLHARHPKLACIALSGLANVPESSFVVHLTKPVPFQDLISVCERLHGKGAGSQHVRTLERS